MRARNSRDEEGLQAATIELDRRVPVDGVEGDVLLEAGLGEPPIQGSVVAALNFVGEQEGKKRGIVQRLSSREGEAFG